MNLTKILTSIITFIILPLSIAFAQTVELHMLDGNQFFQQRKYEQALKSFQSAIDLNPTYAEAYLKRGLTYKQLGESYRMMEDFENAQKLDASILPRYFNDDAYFPATIDEYAYKNYPTEKGNVVSESPLQIEARTGETYRPSNIELNHQF